MASRIPPWHTFTIDGRQYRVRLIRQYEADLGSLWRDYRCAAGGRIAVEARGPGGRRSAPEKQTAREAACWFAGYL